MPFSSDLTLVRIRTWGAVSLVVLVGLLGGASRLDVPQLIVLRPLSVALLCVALLTMRSSDFSRHRFLTAMAVSIIAIVACHLIPLPPSLWHSLPERQIVTQIDDVAGLGDIWRPLTLAPIATWNALFSLAAPLAMFVFAVQMDGRGQAILVRAFAGVIALSGILGMIQAASGGLRLFDISNPVAGLFANRNHQGVILACLFPLLAMIAGEEAQNRQSRVVHGWIITVALATIVPLVFITGSRAGLMALLVSLVLTSFVASTVWSGVLGKLTPRQRLAAFTALVIVAVVGWMSVSAGQYTALDRMTASSPVEDQRIPLWSAMMPVLRKFLPLGSGVGSFPEIIKIYEPNNLLSPEYWNHMHNDWLETVLVAGLPGALLIGAACAAFVLALLRAIHAPRSWSVRVFRARYALIVIGIVGLASFFDYPLRTPMIACFFVFMSVLCTFDAIHARSHILEE